MKRRQLKKLCKKAANLLGTRNFGGMHADLAYCNADEETFQVHGYWSCNYEYPDECDFIDAWSELCKCFYLAYMEVDEGALETAHAGPRPTTRNVLRWAEAEATDPLGGLVWTGVLPAALAAPDLPDIAGIGRRSNDRTMIER